MKNRIGLKRFKKKLKRKGIIERRIRGYGSKSSLFIKKITTKKKKVKKEEPGARMTALTTEIQLPKFTKKEIIRPGLIERIFNKIFKK
ncbi:MAG: hypothetical protein WC554_04770 [Clostridia bacterium]